MALAHSLGAGLAPDNTCTFNRDDGSGSRRDFFIGCPGALAASHACYVTDRWFTPHFLSSWHAFVLVPGWLMLLARLLVSPFGLHVGWTLLIGLLRLPLGIVQDVWDIYRDVLGTVPDNVVFVFVSYCSGCLGCLSKCSWSCS